MRSKNTSLSQIKLIITTEAKDATKEIIIQKEKKFSESINKELSKSLLKQNQGTLNESMQSKKEQAHEQAEKKYKGIMIMQQF